MKKERLMELAGVQLNEVTAALDDNDKDFLAQLVDDAMEKLHEADPDEDYTYRIELLRKLGAERFADSWEKALRDSGE